MKTILYLIPFFIFFGNYNSEIIKKEKLKVGDQLPYFNLIDDKGNTFDTLDYMGKQPLVIFFYKENDSPICTTEACSFRDSFEEFQKLDAKIIGISSNDIVSHKTFIKKNRLPYTLLSDHKKRVRKLFGISKKTARSTYVVNKKGKIVYIYKNQKYVVLHARKALEALKRESVLQK